MAAWIRGGHVHLLEDIGQGLKQMTHALKSLYHGTNSGTRMVRIDAEIDQV